MITPSYLSRSLYGKQPRRPGKRIKAYVEKHFPSEPIFTIPSGVGTLFSLAVDCGQRLGEMRTDPLLIEERKVGALTPTLRRIPRGGHL